MAKQDKKKSLNATELESTETEAPVEALVEVSEAVEEIPVITNTVVEVAPTQALKIIFPEDMDASMKLEDPKPIVKVVAPTVTTGQRAIIKSSGVKEIVGKEGEVLEVRGSDSVVQVGPNKYLIANSSLTQV